MWTIVVEGTIQIQIIDLNWDWDISPIFRLGLYRALAKNKILLIKRRVYSFLNIRERVHGKPMQIVSSRG